MFSGSVRVCPVAQQGHQEPTPFHTTGATGSGATGSVSHPARVSVPDGFKLGIEDGIKTNQLENARRMKADGLDSKLIAKYTGLPESEILTL